MFHVWAYASVIFIKRNLKIKWKAKYHAAKRAKIDKIVLGRFKHIHYKSVDMYYCHTIIHRFIIFHELEVWIILVEPWFVLIRRNDIFGLINGESKVKWNLKRDLCDIKLHFFCKISKVFNSIPGCFTKFFIM